VEIQRLASARLTLHAPSATVAGAQATFYELTIENLSGEDWSPGDQQPVQVSYHWLNAQGDPVIYDGLRSPLPATVPAGGSCLVQLRVHPPALPGRYILAIDLLREGVNWFGLDCRLPVERLPVTQPRAVLINRNCISGDAVGNNIVRKLRLLQKWGYAPLLLANDFDRRLPLADQALMVEIGPARLLDPTPDVQWAAQHFWQASLHIFDYPEYYPLADLISVAPRGAVIFDYHGVTPPELWGSAFSRENIELGLRNLRLVQHADYAIAHSEYTRQELLATGLIAPRFVTTLPYAVPIAAFYPALQPPTSPPSTPGSGDKAEARPGPTLLYVGRMAGNKRIDVLIRMTALVKERYPGVRLLLVGDHTNPAYREVIAEALGLIEELALAEHVIFTGPKRHDDLPAIYNASDIYVTSSLHEGFCIPVIEAMACGVPVVATRAAALPATIGDAGLLFEPGDVAQCAAHVLALLDSRAENGKRKT
jgi:glycosyltransferase involved in cell wall biosynthesis